MAVAIFGVAVWAGAVGVRVHLPYAVPVAIMVVAGTAAAMFSIVPTSGVVAVGQDVFLLLWAAAIANVVRHPRNLAIVLRAWAYGAIGWGLLLLAAVTTGAGWLAGGAQLGIRAELFFDNPNMAGNFFMVSLFVLMASDRPRGLARAAGFAIVAAAVLLTGSLAALGAFAVGAAVAALFAIWRRNDLMTAVAVASVGLLLVGAVATVVIRTDVVTAARESGNVLLENSLGRASRSAAGRTNLFTHEVQLFRTGPLYGRGPASTKANLARSYGDVVKEAHDDYLAALTERGVVGVVGLIAFMIAVGMRGTSVAHGKLRGPFASLIRQPAAFIGVSVALAISAVTHEILHYRHVWSLFGLLAGVYLFARQDRRAERVGVTEIDGPGDAAIARA